MCEKLSLKPLPASLTQSNYMSWLVKRWGKEKYGIYTTVAEGYLHEPKKISKEEAIELIAEIWKEQHDKKVQELWWDKDTSKIIKS